MIDLGPIRTAAETARPAIEEVDLHAEDGLFGKLPAQQAELLLAFAAGSARNVPALIAEVERLSPASYLRGPEACCEGECDEEDPPAGQWCSHVEERVATLGDVKRADHLDSLAKALRRAAEAAERDGGIDDRDMARIVIEAVDEAYEQIAADDEITDVVPPAGLVSADPAGSPHDGDPSHGGGG